MGDVFRELEEDLREGLKNHFPQLGEEVLKKVRVHLEKKHEGDVTTNAAFIVAKALEQPLSWVAFQVGLVTVKAWSGKIADCRVYMGNATVVTFKPKEEGGKGSIKKTKVH